MSNNYTERAEYDKWQRLPPVVCSVCEAYVADPAPAEQRYGACTACLSGVGADEPEGRATVERVRGSYGDPAYVITGTPAAVQAEIDRLRDRWPPAGYGTRVVDDTTLAGVRVARVTRHINCE